MSIRFLGERGGNAAVLLGMAAAGLLLRLAFPPYGLYPAAMAAFAVFFLLLNRARRPFAAGLAFHASFSLFLCSFLWTALHGHFHVGIVPSAAFLLVFAGLLPGLFFAVYAIYAQKVMAGEQAVADFASARRASNAAAAGFVLAEFLRTLLSPEGLWGHLASIYAVEPGILHLASVMGAAGLSFVTVRVAALLALALRAPRRLSARLLALAAATCAVIFWVGTKIPVPAAGQGVAAVLAHPAIVQEERWDSRFNQVHLARYTDMSRSAAFPQGGAARLLVWPETALTYFFADDAESRAALAKLAREKDAWILIGAPSRDEAAGRIATHNSVYLLDPAGRVRGRYDKNRLLPFAESPRWGLSVGGRLHEPYSAGASLEILRLTDPSGRVLASLGAAICFEVADPAHVRRLTRAGADVLVNLANDAWFGGSSESAQQLSLLALNCAQYGVAGIRATGYGVSAFVDATGRIRLFAEGELDTGAPLDAAVEALLSRDRPTSASR